MKVLVTGRSGQVARSLAERSVRFPDMEVLFASRPELDLMDETSIRRVIGEVSPDVIVNAAAYTAVDQAEQEEAIAQQVNGRAPGIIAQCAKEIDARLIHISTDYVFDGRSPEPYSEDAPVCPINAYGRTKAAGEEAVRAAFERYVIIRTSWVYSPFGKNFVKTVLALGEARDELRVVEDQMGTPTSGLDLADGILTVVNGWRTAPERELGSVYHFAGRGSTSWADFARHILETSRTAGGPFAHVIGIPSHLWPTPAVRPANSRLDSSKFRKTFGYLVPHWATSVETVVRWLLTEQRVASGAESPQR